LNPFPRSEFRSKNGRFSNQNAQPELHFTILGRHSHTKALRRQDRKLPGTRYALLHDTDFTNTLQCLYRGPGRGDLGRSEKGIRSSFQCFGSGSGFNQVSGSRSGSVFEIRIRIKEDKNDPQIFEVLDVLFCELKACSVTWTSFMDRDR